MRGLIATSLWHPMKHREVYPSAASLLHTLRRRERHRVSGCPGSDTTGRFTHLNSCHHRHEVSRCLAAHVRESRPWATERPPARRTPAQHQAGVQADKLRMRFTLKRSIQRSFDVTPVADVRPATIISDHRVPTVSTPGALQAVAPEPAAGRLHRALMQRNNEAQKGRSPGTSAMSRNPLG